MTKAYSNVRLLQRQRVALHPDQLEERDLIAEHPEYAQYRKRVPMLVPFTKRRQAMPT